MMIILDRARVMAVLLLTVALAACGRDAEIVDQGHGMVQPYIWYGDYCPDCALPDGSEYSRMQNALMRIRTDDGMCADFQSRAQIWLQNGGLLTFDSYQYYGYFMPDKNGYPARAIIDRNHLRDDSTDQIATTIAHEFAHSFGYGATDDQAAQDMAVYCVMEQGN